MAHSRIRVINQGDLSPFSRKVTEKRNPLLGAFGNHRMNYCQTCYDKRVQLLKPLPFVGLGNIACLLGSNINLLHQLVCSFMITAGVKVMTKTPVIKIDLETKVVERVEIGQSFANGKNYAS